MVSGVVDDRRAQCLSDSLRLVFLFLICLLQTIVVATALTTAIEVQAESPGAASQSRPNIVLILLDDVGYSDLGAYGGEIRTPNIDTLAERGARFSRFYAASSCGPTRAMLLTGVDHHRAGVGSMPELMPLSHRGRPGYLGVLDERVQTVSSALQQHGYFTAVAGKWHLGVETRNLPPARGFDFSFIQADNGSDNFDLQPYLPTQAEARWFENGVRLDALPDGFYSSTYFVDAIMQELAEPIKRRQPFFAYLAFQANHNPLQAPAEFIDAYRGQYLDGWASVRERRLVNLQRLGLLDADASVAPGIEQQRWKALGADAQYFEARRMQAYAGMASAMDHAVGRLLHYLRSEGVHDDTVFIVLSDNGAAASEPYENAFARRWLEQRFHREVETLGTRGSWVSAGRAWGQVSNTPFSGVKFSASEGGVRVPLIVAGVPGTQPGVVLHGRAHVTDITPTLLALAGLQDADDLRSDQYLTATGHSLLGRLRGAIDKAAHEDTALGYEFSGNSALYLGDYKITRNRAPYGNGQWALYNLSVDPGETQDLGSEQPDRLQSMVTAYKNYETEVGVLPMPDDYSLARQAAVNALLFSYLPRYAAVILGAIGCFALGLWWWHRSRHRGESHEQ